MDYMVKYYQNLAEELLHKKFALIEKLKVLSEARMLGGDGESQARRTMYGLPPHNSPQQSWGDWQEGDEDSPEYNPAYLYDKDGSSYLPAYDEGDPFGSYDSDGRPLRYAPRSDRRPAQPASTQTSSANAATATQPPAPPTLLQDPNQYPYPGSTPPAAPASSTSSSVPPNAAAPNGPTPPRLLQDPNQYPEKPEWRPPMVAPPPTPEDAWRPPMLPPGVAPGSSPQPGGGWGSTPMPVPSAPAAAKPAAADTSTSAAPPSGYAPRSAYNFKQDPRYMAGAKDMFQDERKYKAMRGIGLSDYQISKRNEQRAAMDQLRDIEAKKAAGLPVSQREMQDDAFLRAKYGVGSRNLSAPVKQAYTGLSRPPEGSWEKFQQANQPSKAPVSAPQKPAANTTAAAAIATAQGVASAKPGGRAEQIAKAINPVQVALNRATQYALGGRPTGAKPSPAPAQTPPKNTQPSSVSSEFQAGMNRGTMETSAQATEAPKTPTPAQTAARNTLGMGTAAPEVEETENLTPAQRAARETLGMGTAAPPKPKRTPTAAERTLGLG